MAVGFVLRLRSGKTPGATRNQQGRLMIGQTKYWRIRAEEARVLAESKNIMLRIAGDYERMAEIAEQRGKLGGLPSAPWPG